MKQGNRKTDQQAREVIANALLFDISDPRLEFVTIIGCKVSFDRSYCDVYYITEPGMYSEAAEAFESCKGRIRTIMAKKLHWRVAPELRFHLDVTVDDAEKIEYRIAQEHAKSDSAESEE